jgi:LEA14-like dessication related protein
MNIEHFVLLLMIVVSTILVSGCSSIFQEPSVTVGSVDLAHINATDLSLNITLNVENPNPFGIMFRKITADVSYLNGKEWNQLSHIEKEDIDIKVGESTVLLPVSVRNEDLIKAGFHLLLSGDISIQVTGIAEPSFFGFEPRIPFQETRSIPLKI